MGGACSIVPGCPEGRRKMDTKTKSRELAERAKRALKGQRGEFDRMPGGENYYQDINREARPSLPIKQIYNELYISAMELCEEDPALNCPEAESDPNKGLLTLVQWFTDRANKGPGAAKEIDPRYIRAYQSYERALEDAKDKGLMAPADDREIYNYCRTNLEFEYEFPQYETWHRYLREYIRLSRPENEK